MAKTNKNDGRKEEFDESKFYPSSYYFSKCYFDRVKNKEQAIKLLESNSFLGRLKDLGLAYYSREEQGIRIVSFGILYGKNNGERGFIFRSYLLTEIY